MKASHVLIGIVGSVVMIGGALAVRRKTDYDRDAQAITKLIAEYKVAGIPTNGNELVAKIPDSENAWVEIGPLLLTKQGSGTGIIFKSEFAAQFILSTTKDDLPMLHKYLAKNQDARKAIEKALATKSGFQVTHDYNQGFAMLLPEFAAMRPVQREFCLAAYVAALEGDWPTAERNLKVANHFAENCIQRPEQIGALVGAGMRKLIYQTGYQIIQARPEMTYSVIAYLSSPEVNTLPDPPRMMKSEFVAQLTFPRNSDSPEADRQPLPDFLDKVIRPREKRNIWSYEKVNGGDYMPNSYQMRTLLRKRLEAWKPVFEEVRNHKMPSEEEYAKVVDFTRDLPPIFSSFSDMMEVQDADYFFGMSMAMTFSDMNRAILGGIKLKKATGKYPPSLSDFGLQIRTLNPTTKITYTSSSEGMVFKAKSSSANPDAQESTLSYPGGFGLSATSISRNKKAVEDFKSGKRGVGGEDPKKTKPKGASR